MCVLVMSSQTMIRSTIGLLNCLIMIGMKLKHKACTNEYYVINHCVTGIFVRIKMAKQLYI